MEKVGKTQEPSLEGPPRSKVEIVKDEKGIVSHVFITEDDKRFDLYEYIPTGVTFVSSDFIGYKFFPGDPNDKEHPPLVAFPPKEIDTISGRLGLLHEMGHAIREYGEDKRRQSSSQYFMELIHLIDLIVNAIRKSDTYQQLENQEEREKYISHEFEKTRKSGWPPQLQSDERMLESIQALAQEERAVWAEALRLYRKIKKEKDIDILGQTTSAHLRSLIDTDLASYQNRYGKLIPEQQVRLFLTRKYAPETRRLPAVK